MKPFFSRSYSSVAAVRRQRAFSLLEVLAVLSIMFVLAGTSLLGLAGRSSAQSLDNAGNKVVDLINEARENAIGKHVMTALVLVTPGGDPAGNAAIDDRLFVIEQFNQASSSWQPVSQWELLPTGVMVDPANSTTFMQLPSLVNPPTGVSYLGNAIKPAAYQVFLPDGRLAGTSQTPALRLVSERANTPNNYYDVTINPYTGMPIIDRS